MGATYGQGAYSHATADAINFRHAAWGMRGASWAFVAETRNLVNLIGKGAKMNSLRDSALTFAVFAVCILSPARGSAATCAIIEGTHKYNASGDQVSRCQPFAKRTHYKITSRTIIHHPRCAGKRPGFSFIEYGAPGKGRQIVCKVARA
jgi:hypothetical protein